VKGVRAVPYRLPELIAAVAQGKTIFITEGEKASDAVATLGAVATTNAGGSKKIRNELVPFFKGADVVILPDNDEAGEKHLGVVAEKLRTVAARIRVLRLPGLPPKGDVFDWIAAGGTLEDLEVAEAEDIEPESDAAEEAAPDNVVSFLNRKVGGKGKSQRPQDNSADGKPRLLVENTSPDRTVAALRDILSAGGEFYDRGVPVRLVFDQIKQGVIAQVATPDSIVLAAHRICRPYVSKAAGAEENARLPRPLAVMYLDWRGEWKLPPFNGIAAVASG